MSGSKWVNISKKNSWFPKNVDSETSQPTAVWGTNWELKVCDSRWSPSTMLFSPWLTNIPLLDRNHRCKKTLQLMRLLLQQKSLCNNVDHYDGRWFLVLVVDQNGIWALSKLQSFWLVRASLLISGQFPTGKNLLPLKSHTTQTKLCFSAESFFLHTHIQPYGGYPNKWGEWA
jgi:hypothetical protein